tara:strand:+ start:483 stop:680 length:198 start_codon:yes stop_codon:yes gene_type:complete
MDNIELEKMKFIYSALENGWTVKKNKDKYIFTKKHYDKKEIFSNDFLSRFMKENLLQGKFSDFGM